MQAATFTDPNILSVTVLQSPTGVGNEVPPDGREPKRGDWVLVIYKDGRRTEKQWNPPSTDPKPNQMIMNYHDLVKLMGDTNTCRLDKEGKARGNSNNQDEAAFVFMDLARTGATDLTNAKTIAALDHFDLQGYISTTEIARIKLGIPPQG